MAVSEEKASTGEGGFEPKCPIARIVIAAVIGDECEAVDAIERDVECHGRFVLVDQVGLPKDLAVAFDAEAHAAVPAFGEPGKTGKGFPSAIEFPLVAGGGVGVETVVE